MSVEVSEEGLALLAHRLEDAQRRVGAIRYGSVFRVGLAHLVINPDSPLASANFAATLAGSPDAAEQTLAVLPTVCAEAGRSQSVLVESPSSLPELGVLAEEAGFEAVEEGTALLLADQAALADGEPGRLARPLREADEGLVAALVADAFGWSAAFARRLAPTLGQRLDDPRVAAFAAYDDGSLAAVALCFVDGDVAQVTEVAVRPGSRHRRLGRAVASAAAWHGLQAGARTVFVLAEPGGLVERIWGGLGFVSAYDTVTYVLRW